MKNKFLKLIGTSVLSISLIAGAASVVSANGTTTSTEGTPIEVVPMALQTNTFNWDLLSNTIADPVSSWNIAIGYPHINLYVKNTGSSPWRIEVKHKTKGTIIFNKTVPADRVGYNFINNDYNPLVPSGDYSVTIYGGTSAPKGQVIMKASDTPW